MTHDPKLVEAVTRSKLAGHTTSPRRNDGRRQMSEIPYLWAAHPLDTTSAAAHEHLRLI